MYTRPLLPITLIAFCLTLVFGALVLPSDTFIQTHAILGNQKQLTLNHNSQNTFSFRIVSNEVGEGDHAKVVITSSLPIEQTTRIKVRIVGGTAKNNSDFKFPKTRWVTFYKGGPTEKAFLFPILNDEIKEPQETIIFSLYSGQGELLNNKAMVTINDSEYVPDRKALLYKVIIPFHIFFTNDMFKSL